MRKLNILYLTLIIIITASCASTEDITMFHEPDNSLNKYYVPPKAPEHKIRPFDNLYLSVLTLDPEVNSLFNPSSGGNGYTSGTQQMYGTPEGRDINGYRVSDKGTITVPIIGEINLLGLSLAEAQDRIREKAQEYLKQPTIQVKYLNYKVNLLGEVRSPGIYYNYEGNISILDAIAMANGITDYADIKNTVIKRYSGNKVTTHKVNLTDNSLYTSEIFYLQPYDVIYIPPSNLKRKRENAQTYSQVLSTISVLLVSVTLILNF